MARFEHKTTQGDLKTLIAELERIGVVFGGDWELTHVMADEALLLYVGDEEVAALHGNLARWYA